MRSGRKSLAYLMLYVCAACGSDGGESAPGGTGGSVAGSYAGGGGIVGGGGDGAGGGAAGSSARGGSAGEDAGSVGGGGGELQDAGLDAAIDGGCLLDCAPHGQCLDGQCECETGYSGEDCQACATGFSPDADGQCIADACAGDPCEAGLVCVPTIGQCCPSDCQPGIWECEGGATTRVQSYGRRGLWAVVRLGGLRAGGLR